MNQSRSVIILFLTITHLYCAFANLYVYQFGQNVGDIIFEYAGQIPLLTPVTIKDIPVPSGYDVTYVKVTVDAISPPKVDYSNKNQQVTITFSWSQVSLSSYTITVKGISRPVEYRYQLKDFEDVNYY